MLVRDHTSKAFEPKAIDHHIVDFCGKNQVLVKDNYGNKKKVHVKDVKPIEMDIATDEFFRKEREQCTTRDAKHVMPIKLIPDLEWEFIKMIDVMESDKGVTIYCIKETEDENEDTQVKEPKTDVKTPENIEPVVTEAVEAPRAAETAEDTNTTETEEPRYENRESLKIATEDAVPWENSEISEYADPRYEHREKSETVAEDAVPREMTEEIEPTGNTGISQAVLVDQAEDAETTEVSEQADAEEIKRTDTIDVTEVITGIPEPTLEITSSEEEESMITPPGSPQKENPEFQNNSEGTTEMNAETSKQKDAQIPRNK